MPQQIDKPAPGDWVGPDEDLDGPRIPVRIEGLPEELLRRNRESLNRLAQDFDRIRLLLPPPEQPFVPFDTPPAPKVPAMRAEAIVMHRTRFIEHGQSLYIVRPGPGAEEPLARWIAARKQHEEK